jgi:hypothetical protein
MNMPHYNYATKDFRQFEFVSRGPKGAIKKLVAYTKIQDDPIMYNLAFGDENPKTRLLDDSVKSNNEDRDKVLATVANTIINFSDHYGNHLIYATGSSPARTRLYQMSIAAMIDKINKDFDVYGVKDLVAYPFQKNVNYDAFVVKRK